MSFQIINKSVFDGSVDAICNTINVVGAMGAGIALEFKQRYPEMFSDYKAKCKQKMIKPGDCYLYKDEERNIYILGLAVKDDWRHWSTLEWIESSLKSLKLVILENDIKSVNLPLPGGMNGRRGPYGKVPNMTSPPADKEEIKTLVRNELEKFAIKFNIEINLCIPDKTTEKKESAVNLTQFLQV
jgi:hypothetical protein